MDVILKRRVRSPAATVCAIDTASLIGWVMLRVISQAVTRACQIFCVNPRDFTGHRGFLRSAKTPFRNGAGVGVGRHLVDLLEWFSTLERHDVFLFQEPVSRLKRQASDSLRLRHRGRSLMRRNLGGRSLCSVTGCTASWPTLVLSGQTTTWTDARKVLPMLELGLATDLTFLGEGRRPNRRGLCRLDSPSLERKCTSRSKHVFQ